MSRRLPSTQRRIPSVNDNNPYQPTTVPVTSNGHPHAKAGPQYQDYNQRHQNPCRNGYHLKPTTTIDIGLSDETTDTQSYYDYYQHSPLKESRNTDCTFSDDSGSTRLPYYEFDDESHKRYSRNAFSDRSLKKGPEKSVNVHTRKVYPNHEAAWDRLYQEIPSACGDNVGGPRRVPLSRMSDRPQSSLSSGVTSAIVYGCGGKCQTFENICYFFLQLVFAMGILIGVSLSIAGLVLRKSAARNLQVLVYIGVLLAMVSGLLLGIQCNARNTAKKRKKAIHNAKRAPIQMETLHTRVGHQLQMQQQLQFQQQQQQQQPLMMVKEGGGHSQRVVQMPQVHQNVQRAILQRPLNPGEVVVIDEQGIPWWRRKDINTR